MVQIVTDSTSDITQEAAARLKVNVIPLLVTFGEDTYRDGVDISCDEFFRRLKVSKTLPVTSQPTPNDFLPVFQAAKDAGDSVVAIMLTSSLSGTYQSAQIAKKMVDYDEIYVVDSRVAIGGLHFLVDRAVALRDQGATAQEIADTINAIKFRVQIFGVVDTLEFFYKGGRLSRTGMMAGTLLNFKPVLTLREGEIKILDKARGTAKGIATLFTHLDKVPPDLSHPVYYGYTDTDEKCQLLIAEAKARYGINNFDIATVGPVIGTHVGPGAGVISYLAKA